MNDADRKMAIKNDKTTQENINSNVKELADKFKKNDNYNLYFLT